MCQQNISFQNQQEEQSVHQLLFDKIDSFQSLVFNAGAGAGKTYSLIESLKHIIKENNKKLQRNNQQIACITYTNAGVEEIRSRLGHSDLVQVSTIHEMLWSLIETYQVPLMKCHIAKLNSEILNIDAELSDVDGFASNFSELHAGQKQHLKQELIDRKEEFYRFSGLNANAFRDRFSNHLEHCPQNLRTNIGNFKKLVRKIYKKENYERCLQLIDSKVDGYTQVSYDARFNNDVLHKMRFSHDTLIDYAHTMFTNYELLKRITVDSFPYFLVDEYQDTNPQVVRILNDLDIFSQQNNRLFFVGYFGDKAQHIYDDGVGNDLDSLHGNLQIVEKSFNRRSTNQVIGVINKIRNDEVEQRSIYSDFNGSCVEFYTPQVVEQATVGKFIQKCSDDWQISNNNKLNCLVLTNKTLAKLSGFEALYEGVSKSKYYKTNFNNLNTEFLSNDTKKLGYVPLLFFRFIELLIKLEQESTKISEVFGKSITDKTKFSEVREALEKLHRINNATNLKASFERCFEEFLESPSLFQNLVNDIVGLSSFEDFLNHVLHKFNPNLDLEDDTAIEEAKTHLNTVFEISLIEYKNWVNFILEQSDKDVVFHTYHGTKGREFDNVLIIGQNDFGSRNRNKFSNYFKGVDNPGLIADPKNHDNTKNLLYVACSRARKNLRVLYLDDIEEFEDGVKSIFGQALNFS